MHRTITLTPEEVRACVLGRAQREINGWAGTEMSVAFFEHADGTGAIVMFADKDAPRPPSVLPIERKKT